MNRRSSFLWLHLWLQIAIAAPHAPHFASRAATHDQDERPTIIVRSQQAARRRLAQTGKLTGPEVTAADRTFQAGDRVGARRNQRLSTIDGATAQVMNGQRGTITAVDPATRAVTVAWDGRTPTVLPARYLDAGHLDHGYAITGHRAQGLTVNQTWIPTSDGGVSALV